MTVRSNVSALKKEVEALKIQATTSGIDEVSREIEKYRNMSREEKAEYEARLYYNNPEIVLADNVKADIGAMTEDEFIEKLKAMTYEEKWDYFKELRDATLKMKDNENGG